jgi:hypothetical protein
MRFADKYAQRDKHLLRLERELARLNQARWNAPIIPLEHPYQRGWVKTFTLREDAWHHPEALIYQAVLVVVNDKVSSRNREFTTTNGRPIVLRPKILDPRKWHRLNWPINHHRLFACGWWQVDDTSPWSDGCRRDWIYGFKLIRTWWLEEVVTPHMITHQRVDLPEVRARIAEIENHLRVRLGWEKLTRLHGRRVRWREGCGTVATQRADTSYTDQNE